MEQRYLDKPWETGRRIPVNEDKPPDGQCSNYAERFYDALYEERERELRKESIRDATIKTIVVAASTVFILWILGYFLSSILAVGGPLILICAVIFLLNEIFDWV